MSGPLYEFVAAQGPECTVIHLNGDIDFAAVLEMGPRLEELAVGCDGELGFDLEGVTFIDSEGLKMLIMMFELMWRKGSRARIQKLSDRVRRVMEMAGVADILLGAGPSTNSDRQFVWRTPGPGLSQRS